MDSESSSFKIPFPFIRGDDSWDRQERWTFWESETTLRYFIDHGYTLYKRIMFDGWATSNSVPRLPFEDFSEGPYPYAFYDTQMERPTTKPLRADDHSGAILYAQDSQNRHVAIKLVRDGTDELRILRFLSEQNLETLKENCVIPVLDIFPADGFWFAVMPRWGNHIDFPPRQTMRDYLQIMHSMLKAVTFLHHHNILHKDIKMENLVVDHFADTDSLGLNEVRRRLRNEGKLSYAMIDFDWSMMVAPESKGRCRFPYHMSWWGSGFSPHDTRQGEFDYDPFAFDVGMLGVVFCVHYQQHSKRLPMLAPLLDWMTTRDIERRPSAAQALEFFEQLRSELTDDQLDMEDVYAGAEFELYDEFDRWKDIPDDFATKWASYREPPVPRLTKFLRWICEPRWMWTIVPWVRWTFFQFTTLPRRAFTHFVGFRVFGYPSRRAK
ncbi:hypothetical protein M413DRAFT_449518 [Hebeloma cylindrosporum]|uniref:Protein kinase domain-containing protein n=1 Tax=Hebeloma cylindrosporum TaxID=76867 RepID=A0A0C3BGM4_HEBCY|nr:hypothetical protein M413DRAFT_449518 [Hebeloma cylindrosporum h7]